MKQSTIQEFICSVKSSLFALALAAVAVLSLPSCVSAQDLVFDKAITMKEFSRTKEALPVVNADGTVSIFVLGTKTIKGVLLDANFDLIDSISGSRPGGFPNLLGYSKDGDSYVLFFGSKDYKKFTALTAHYPSRALTVTPLKLASADEEYGTCLSHNGRFYLISSFRPNGIRVYAFINPSSVVAGDFAPDHVAFSNSNLFQMVSKEVSRP